MSTLSAPAARELGAHECWELLRAATLGRLAVVVSGRPEIFPVNFATDHGTIVFRSAAGTKISGLHSDTAAAFEVDGQDSQDGTAWSVVIKGHLEILVSFDPITTDVLPLFPLQGGPKPQFVRVVPDAITGRRFRIVEPSTWRTIPAAGRSQAWE
jgi:uncharacterized protein